MVMTQKLELHQSQTVTMTTQLVQAIKVLQFSNQELASYIECKLESNPFLERCGNQDGNVEIAGGYSEDGQSQPSMGAGSSGALSAKWDGPHQDWLNNYPSPPPSLHDHLLQQLRIAITEQLPIAIGRAIIAAIDDHGYFKGDLGEIANKVGCDYHQVVAVLSCVQQFEPTGVGARDIGECLKLQLIERNRLTPAMHRLLERVELIGQYKFSELRKHCQVDDAMLQGMLALLRSLNPRPGCAYVPNFHQQIIPDILVNQAPDGGLEIELNEAIMPKLLINNDYQQHIPRSGLDAVEKAFITKYANSASWLIRILEQRAQTILKVSKAIVAKQSEFFANGVQYLRPLNMKAIAEVTELHESTISRVANNKYLSCRRGTFRLRYFFSSTLSSLDSPHDLSGTAVRDIIKELIAEETLDDVLSDEAIAVKLKLKWAINIARRTVTKYRESMNIPSSSKRRRYRQMKLRASG